jgi:PIN domain nuclease of toxin-antitoxin system
LGWGGGAANSEPEKIPARLRKIIEATSSRNELHLSAISPWEVAMLVERKRLRLEIDTLLCWE